MSRDDLALVDGVVTNILTGGVYEVRLNNNEKIISAKLCGKMRKFRIRVIIGDSVSVGLSPYDLTHGLIMSRMKAAPAPGDQPQQQNFQRHKRR